MQIKPVRGMVFTLIKPQKILFNTKKIMYEIGQTTIYADTGHGSVHLSKDGSIYAYRLKNIGICTLGNNFAKPQRIVIQNSTIIGNIAIREKDIVTLRNCKLPAPKPPKSKYEPIVDIVYTNKP